VISAGRWCDPNGGCSGSITAILRLMSSSMIARRAAAARAAEMDDEFAPSHVALWPQTHVMAKA
jgi:hypothetical protein